MPAPGPGDLLGFDQLSDLLVQLLHHADRQGRVDRGIGGLEPQHKGVVACGIDARFVGLELDGIAAHWVNSFRSAATLLRYSRSKLCKSRPVPWVSEEIPSCCREAAEERSAAQLRKNGL